ncbi:MAG: glycerophosphodiester phosphodiesterase [Spirochaetes bacterium]|nr:MAG: glycerophosphodiester phosphodiesterase [Spirochaetota bacterium]
MGMIQPRFLFIPAALLFFYSCNSSKTEIPQISTELSSVPLSLDVQAHRGGRGRYPENTLSAFAWSQELGVDTWEMDVALTSDGIPVLSHDPFLKGSLVRDENGDFLENDIRIADLTLDELKHFQVGEIQPGTRYKERFPDQHSSSESIPSLDEVFQLAEESGGTVRFNIEIKTYPSHPEWTAGWETVTDTVISVIKEHEMENRTTVQSFDWRTLTRIKELYPEMKISCLTVKNFKHGDAFYNLQIGQIGPSPWLAGFDADDYGSVAELVSAFGADVYSPYYKELSSSEIKVAQSLGLEIVTWTVNEKNKMKLLIDAGVNGIISDYPDILIEVSGNNASNR